jgi:nucleoside-diphosphate-sugar epimerase
MDIRDLSSVKRCFTEHRPDAVVHGAAITPGQFKEKQWAREVLEINLMGTVTLLEAAKELPTTRLIYLSSGAVYGANAFKFDLLDEQSTPCEPESLYAISKYAAERLWLRSRHLWQLDALVARVGAIFGRWERDTGIREPLSPMLQTVDFLRRGKEAILPRPGLRDWVYGCDCAQALTLLVLEKDPGYSVYNISTGRSWSVADWCESLAELFPNFNYRIARGKEEGNINFHGPKDRNPLCVDRLFNDLNFRPKFDLGESQKDYLAWLSDNPGYLSNA